MGDECHNALAMAIARCKCVLERFGHVLTWLPVLALLASLVLAALLLIGLLLHPEWWVRLAAIMLNAIPWYVNFFVHRTSSQLEAEVSAIFVSGPLDPKHNETLAAHPACATQPWLGSTCFAAMFMILVKAIQG